MRWIDNRAWWLKDTAKLHLGHVCSCLSTAKSTHIESSIPGRRTWFFCHLLTIPSKGQHKQHH